VLFCPLESLQCPWVFVKRHEKQITMKAQLLCNVCLSSKTSFSFDFGCSLDCLFDVPHNVLRFDELAFIEKYN
jgi:hypothetical protein